MRLILGLDRPQTGIALIKGRRSRDLHDPLRTVSALHVHVLVSLSGSGVTRAVAGAGLYLTVLVLLAPARPATGIPPAPGCAADTAHGSPARPSCPGASARAARRPGSTRTGRARNGP